jgi:hypothetical protein
MTKEQWETVSSRARALLNYGIVKAEWLQECRVARFITAVPYLAKCEKATETAFAHLLIYLASLDESAREIFFHKPEDDGNIYNRLSPILNFHGGNEATLNCCRDLLALCMVSNYQKDAETDKVAGKYNPLNAGVWDAQPLIEKLKASIDASITPEIAQYYTTEEALRGYWSE